MRVVVVGTRGLPGVHGGVEQHCERLYPELVQLGCEVTVVGRAGYGRVCDEFRGVRIKRIEAPSKKGVEALVHTRRAIRWAAESSADIVHIHSVGPAILVPYARALGLKRVVVTIHAPDYEQIKWGVTARALLRMGERMAMRHASEVICVSQWYARRLESKYNRAVTVIPNGPGVTPQDASDSMHAIPDVTSPYVLFVGRMIRDKRVEDLIDAASGVTGLSVVLVGGAADTERYYAGLRAKYESERVVFLGFRYGRELADIYSGCRVFALPSGVEGLPVALLEAMSFGKQVIASDIPANREILGANEFGDLYPLADVGALRALLRQAVEHPDISKGRAAAAQVATQYAWSAIGERTLRCYERSGGLHP